MDEERGHEAELPWQVSARGWMDIVKRARKNSAEGNLCQAPLGDRYQERLFITALVGSAEYPRKS